MYSCCSLPQKVSNFGLCKLFQAQNLTWNKWEERGNLFFPPCPAVIITKAYYSMYFPLHKYSALKRVVLDLKHLRGEMVICVYFSFVSKCVPFMIFFLDNFSAENIEKKNKWNKIYNFLNSCSWKSCSSTVSLVSWFPKVDNNSGWFQGRCFVFKSSKQSFSLLVKFWKSLCGSQTALSEAWKGKTNEVGKVKHEK